MNKAAIGRIFLFWLSVLFFLIGSVAIWGQIGLGITTIIIGILFAAEYCIRVVKAE